MKILIFLMCFIPYFSEGQWITDSIEIDQKLKYITDLEELSIVYAPNGLGCNCNEFI